MNFRRVFFRPVPLTLCAVAALALIISRSPAELPATPSPLAETPGTSALRAAIDPETGSLVIGPGATGLTGDLDKAQDAELARMLSRSDEGLVPVVHPDGRVSVHLEGRFMSTSVARIGADGLVETLCTEDQSEAEAFLQDKSGTDANGWEVQ
ncbi:MAG: hypothetical protein QNL91_08065 [Candidatus Krumholzibacteria bacterium]|nr:hypothetical protein [Candidatus Krumholzibacteria bacterium]